MIKKHLLAGITAAAFLFGLSSEIPMLTGTGTIEAAAADAASYTYEITPLLKPFNDYFFVKTNNPDPLSFRFVDKNTIYGTDGSSGSLDVNYDSWDEEMIIYPDVVYEDKTTGRVNGGYIFRGSDTDGGEVTLQYKKTISYSEYKQLRDAGNTDIGEITETTSSSGNYKSYRIVGYYKWETASKKITLPTLMDERDYLIKTYSKGSTLFDKLDAIQSGFSSICLYSGSWIRGELYRHSDYWALSTSPHKDQSFYIQSPYSRKDNQSLFATAIYPFRYDSLGFPGMMSSVAKKLDSTCTVSWDSYNHYEVHVTSGGTTKAYGGQGNGKGQAITEDKLTHLFSFKGTDLSLTLDSVRSVLTEYAKLDIPDDVPRDDELKWEQVWNTVGEGSWVRVIGLNSIYGGTSSGTYCYLYQKNDGDYYWTEDIGSGSSIYWGGDVGYASDCWVDGRYVNSNEYYVPGAKFEDHPTSSLIVKNFKFPEVTYTSKYNYVSGTGYVREYSNVKVTEKTKTVRFSYNSTDKVWRPTTDAFDFQSGTYFSDYKALVEKGLLAKKYLDAIELTEAEVKALNVDKNTNGAPLRGYIYDRSAAPGTPFLYRIGDVNCDGSVDRIDANILSRFVAGWEGYEERVDKRLADLNGDGNVDRIDANILSRCVADWDGYKTGYIKEAEE